MAGSETGAEPLGEAEYAAAHLRWMIEAGTSPPLAGQLVQLGARTAAAVDTRRLGVRVGGEVVSMADLYLDGAVAQVENLMTFEAHRGRGHAGAVVTHGVELARSAGAELVFLVTGEQDGPLALYERLGFDAIGVEQWPSAWSTG